jgi:hypothetical protein
MQANDLVMVIKSPPHFYVNIAHEVGFIEEIQERDGVKYALFYALQPGGRCSGTGSVPLDCLKVINDNTLVQSLKKEYDAVQAEHLSMAISWSNKVNSMTNKAKERAENETGVSLRNIEKIFEIHEKLINEIDRERS